MKFITKNPNNFSLQKSKRLAVIKHMLKEIRSYLLLFVVNTLTKVQKEP